MAGIAAFDVVVVGGGAAGCVVAARLAESASRSVLLLEAGPDLRAGLPAGFRDGWRLPQGFDWGYASEPDGRGVAAGLRRGKLLGGTSWLTRFALRGWPADYDEWAGLGNAGWGFADVLPYFRRLEADADFGDRPWHGDAGPVPVSRYLGLEFTEIGVAGLQALEAAGFPPIDDHNRPGAVGAARMPMSSRDGIRVTTADAYLPSGDTPANLTIRPGAQVAGVVLEDTIATGVRLVDGQVIEAGWVVLCAGTYGSPPILMRSGIGPAAHLRAHGITVRADLPGVGANLADHAGADIDCGYRGPTRAAPILHLLVTFHSSATPSDQAPDLMLWLSDPRGDPPVFEIDAGLLRPRSRGTVRLRSADPADPPRIDLPGLRDPSDAPGGSPKPTCAGSRSPPGRRSGGCAPTRLHPSRPASASYRTWSARTVIRSPTSPEPARWARARTTARSPIPPGASTARTGSASSTPRSSPTGPRHSPTSRS